MNILDCNNNNKYKQYSLNENIFDPSKFSPPNCFIHNLKFRINNMSFVPVFSEEIDKKNKKDKMEENFNNFSNKDNKDNKNNKEEQTILELGLDCIFTIELDIQK